MWWRSHKFKWIDFCWFTVCDRLIQCNCYSFRTNRRLQAVKLQMLCGRWFSFATLQRLSGGLHFHSKSIQKDFFAHSKAQARFWMFSLCGTWNAIRHMAFSLATFSSLFHSAVAQMRHECFFSLWYRVNALIGKSSVTTGFFFSLNFTQKSQHCWQIF